MMEAIRSWLWSVIAASLLAALALAASPKGNMKTVCRFAASLCILACVLRPLGTVQVEKDVLDLSAYERQRRELSETYAREAEQSMEAIIERTCETYISDKAKELGIYCTAEVTAQSTDGVPQVYRAVLHGERSEELSSYMEQALGIARDQQFWIEAE